MVTLILLPKDKLARLVLDLEDYDIPVTGDKEEYPNLSIAIGDSSDFFSPKVTMPGTEIGLKLVVAPKGWSNHQVTPNGKINRISGDSLSPFEKCRIVRQLSRDGRTRTWRQF